MTYLYIALFFLLVGGFSGGLVGHLTRRKHQKRNLERARKIEPWVAHHQGQLYAWGIFVSFMFVYIIDELPTIKLATLLLWVGYSLLGAVASLYFHGCLYDRKLLNPKLPFTCAYSSPS